MAFTNLDELKAESKTVAFLEKEFEVGYIPCGLSIPMLESFNRDIKEQKEEDSPEKILKDNIRMVSLFCSYYESEFTEEYLSQKATQLQIVAMYQLIITAIVKNFSEALPTESDSSSQKKTTGGE